MARRSVRLVTAFFLFAAFSSCIAQDLPVRLDVDSRFTEDELAQIAWAVETWNRDAGARLGGPVVAIGERVEDEFDLGDIADGRHVIYRIGDPQSAEGELFAGWDPVEGHVGGHATLADMQILVFALRGIAARFGSDELYPLLVRAVVLHELGHTLGVSHFTHREGIMNPTLTGDSLADPHLTDADLDAFCISNGCD